jgi:hypothetical protein
VQLLMRERKTLQPSRAKARTDSLRVDVECMSVSSADDNHAGKITTQLRTAVIMNIYHLLVSVLILVLVLVLILVIVLVLVLVLVLVYVRL